MAITKVTTSGLTDSSVTAAKIDDGTLTSADIAPGTITTAKLAGSITNAKLANSSITFNGSAVSLGGSTNLGSISWQSVVVADGSTATTGVAGRGYFINTTSAAHTLNLPSSPSAGDTIAIKDYAGTFGSNSLTIGRNGKKIQGLEVDSAISTDRASVVCVFIDDTRGWLFTVESNVQNFATYVTATGGTVTTSGDFKIHTFTSSGNFVVSDAGSPGGSNAVSYLVVAGGGGGAGSQANNRGGGGGGGGFREGKSPQTPYTSSPSPIVAPDGLPVSAATYPITVGGGGAQGTGHPSTPQPPSIGTNGSNSVFSTITSAGGGGGGGGSPPGNGTIFPGQPGGNGGGGGGGGTGPGTCARGGGNGNTPPVSPAQGTKGGAGGIHPGNPGAPDQGGGGGGGVTGPRGNPSGPSAEGGKGAAGGTTEISGSSVAYGGGGGADGPNGSCYPGGSAATGGTAANADGTANRGPGGGGGGANGSGGNGGSGIVIIRYKYQN